MESKLLNIARKVEFIIGRQSARLMEHSKTKNLLGEYTVSCSQLQIEINRLVEQLENVQMRRSGEVGRTSRMNLSMKESREVRLEGSRRSTGREHDRKRVLEVSVQSQSAYITPIKNPAEFMCSNKVEEEVVVGCER